MPCLIRLKCLLSQLKKRIYYAIVTNDSDFGHPDEGNVPSAIPNGEVTDAPASILRISKADYDECMRLMELLAEDFTPTLFQPTTGFHMECTDVFGTHWMAAVVNPALEDGGTYKPIQTLKRMMAVDWVKHGLCQECAIAKRKEWEGDARAFWNRIDGWIVTGSA